MYNVPDYMTRLSEGTTFELRRKYEIVAVLATQPFDCERCVLAHRQYLSAARQLVEDPDASAAALLGTAASNMIHFAIIDADEEGAEFADLIDREHDYRMHVPSLLIYKRQFQEQGRPPLSFHLNDNVAEDLPRLLLRLVGPPLSKVSSESHLMRRLSSYATESVSVGVWMDEVPDALKSIVDEDRLETLYHHLSSPGTANPMLLAKFNSPRADVVLYHYRGPFNMAALFEEMNASSMLETEYIFFNKSLDYSRLFDHQQRIMAKALPMFRIKRPGHEFDMVTKITVKDAHPPSSCTEKRCVTGDGVIGRIRGYTTDNRATFADTKEEEFIIGAHRMDFPELVNVKGFVGLCPGMKRQMAFPPGRAYPADASPPGVTANDRVVFNIEMIRWSNALAQTKSEDL